MGHNDLLVNFIVDVSRFYYAHAIHTVRPDTKKNGAATARQCGRSTKTLDAVQ
jgi:hypothetical protein